MLFPSWLRSRPLGISAAALALGLTACASGPRAVRYSTPPPELAPPGNLLATSNDPAASAPVVRQPRVIIPAPPLATSAPSQPAGANTLVDPYAADATTTQGVSAAVPTPSAPATAGAAPVASAAATPAPAAPAAYVASSVAPPLAGFTPQASPLLAAFDSSPHGQAPAPMDPMVQQMQRRGPGSQGWTPDFRPSYYGSYGGYGSSYYGPSYYGGPGYYGRSYGYGGGYYGPSYGYGYRPGLGLGIGLGLGFGLGRHSRGWGGHHGHHGGFHGGGHRHR